MNKVFGFFLFMLVTLGAASALDSAPDTKKKDLPPPPAKDGPILPKDVSDANQLLGQWVNGLVSKSMEVVEKQLGKPTERDTWMFLGKQEQLLRYKTGQRSALELRFKDNIVLAASLLVLSE